MKKIIFASVFLLGALAALGQQRLNPALDSLRNEKDPKRLQERITQLEKGDENDMGLLIQYYRANRNKADSLTQVVLSRFPKGRFAAGAAQSLIFNEPSGEKQEEMLGDFKKSFPDADLNQLYYSIAYAYSKSKNVPKITGYAEKITLLDYKYGIVQSLLVLDPKAAETIVKKDVEQLSKGGKTDDYYKAIGFYSNVLTLAGKHADALKYTKEAYDHATVKDDLLTRNYGYLLSVGGNYKDALPFLQQLAVDGKADPQIKAALKQAYAKLNPGKDATAYMSSLEQQLKSNIQTAVAKAMVNEPAPNFTVKDVDGKTVSLADFKGKIIILDFWATWCGPCKRSFPAMQMALNKYKNDPNVKFLFIHTWERVADPLTDAKEYLSTNKYSFDLYMDTKDASTKANPAVSLFKVRGIPAKFIIDGQGQIRFKLTGFGGGDDAAVEELSAMIESSRKS